MIPRRAKVIAQEIGKAVMKAADDLTAFSPDLEAVVPFDLDGTAYTAKVAIKGPVR